MSSRSLNRSGRHADGFTLIEVLISIFIMTFISIGIYQATTETFRLRDRLTVEGEFYNSTRFAIDILQRDITMMYTPTLILPLSEQPAVKKPNTPGTSNPFADPSDPLAGGGAASPDLPEPGDDAQKTKFFMPAIGKTGVRPMRFQGAKDKMSFLTASFHRVYADSKASELAKVTYELGEDERKEGLEPGVATQALVKTESPNITFIDDDKDEGFKTYKLLYGIKTLAFRYCRVKDGKCVWFDNWDSDLTDTKNQYPDMVEVKIEILGPQKLRYEGTYEFRPEMPLRGLSPST